MGKSDRPSAKQVKRQFVEDGERLLGIDEGSAKRAARDREIREIEKAGLKEWLQGAIRLMVAAFGDSGKRISIVLIALLLAIGAYVVTRDKTATPTPKDAGPVASSPVQGANAGGTGPGGGAEPGGTEQGGPSAPAGHNESSPDHVPQGGWTPTYVKVPGWQVALARKDVLSEDWAPVAGEAKEGSIMLLVDLFVMNEGQQPKVLKTEQFELVDGAGKTYPMRAFEPDPGTQEVEARTGSPVAMEASFQVPLGTQGLKLRFAPEGATQPAEVELPEIRYPIPAN